MSSEVASQFRQDIKGIHGEYSVNPLPFDEWYDVGAACTAGVGACESNGLKVCSVDGTHTECTTITVIPGIEPRVCDGIDNDCDGTIDELILGCTGSDSDNDGIRYE